MRKLTDYEQQKLPYRRKTDMVVTNGDQVLLLITIKKDGTKRHSLPGGKIDKGETPLQAGIRECQEETGVVCTDGKLLNFKRVQDFEYNPDGSKTTRTRYAKFRGTYSEFAVAKYSHLDFSKYDDERNVSNGWFSYSHAVSLVMKHAQGPFIVDAFKLAGLIPGDFKPLENDEGPLDEVRAERLDTREVTDVVIKDKDNILLMRDDGVDGTEWYLPTIISGGIGSGVEGHTGFSVEDAKFVGESYEDKFEYKPYSNEKYMQAYYDYSADNVSVALCSVTGDLDNDNAEWFSNVEAHLKLKGGRYIKSLQIASPVDKGVSKEHFVLRTDKISVEEAKELPWNTVFAMVVFQGGKVLVHTGALEDGRQVHNLPKVSIEDGALNRECRLSLLKTCGILIDDIEDLGIKGFRSYTFSAEASDEEKRSYYSLRGNEVNYVVAEGFESSYGIEPGSGWSWESPSRVLKKFTSDRGTVDVYVGAALQAAGLIK